jgi:hypothetical protein
VSRRNERLAQLMGEARLSNKGLARAVRMRARAADEYLGTDHTLVKKWLDGLHAPRGNTPRYIAGELTARLGRIITPADIGFDIDAAPITQLATRFTPELSTTFAALDGLWSADLEGRSDVRFAEVEPGSWREASHLWLIGQRPRPLAATDTRRVGAPDVAAIRATVDHFAGLDDRFGGGIGRPALIAFLANDVAPLLRASATDATRRLLFVTVAEATLLAGWMSYDTGLHGLGQRYFVQALRLAQEAQDRQLGGSILSAMSHQATFLGRYREAAELARAGVAGIMLDGTPTLRAQFQAMEARALARMDDVHGCDAALADAQRYFERRNPQDDPDWMQYFDELELAAEIAHCYRDLGRSAAAIEQLDSQIVAGRPPVRSDVFVTMVRADAHAAAGDLEQACVVAAQALDLGRDLRSERPKAYLREFAVKLAPQRTNRVVRSFLEQVADDELWAASTHGTTSAA